MGVEYEDGVKEIERFGCFFYQSENDIRDFCLSRGIGDEFKRKAKCGEWLSAGNG